MYDYDPFAVLGASFGAFIAGLLAVLIVPLLIAYVLFSVFYMKLFEKAGVNDKWRAWIPVYREMIFFKIGDMNPWLVLIFAVGGGVLSIIYIGSLLLAAFTIFWAMAVIRISFKAKNEAAWAALALGLPGLGSIIWLGIMAFSKDPWQPQIPQAKWANTFLGDKTNWQGVPFGGVPTPAYGGAQPYGYGQQAPGYPAAPGYAAPAAPQDPYGAPEGYAAPAAPYGETPAAPAAPQDSYVTPDAPADPFAEPAAPAAPADPFAAPAEPAAEPAAAEEPADPFAAFSEPAEPASSEPSIDFGEAAATPDDETDPPAEQRS